MENTFHNNLNPAKDVATHQPDSSGWVEDILASNTSGGQSHVVENLLFPGLSIIAGSPKVGKTNFAFQIASSVALGAPLFGQLEVSAGRVLYIALEETQDLTAKRLALMGVQLPPKSVYVEYSFPPLSRGGAGQIGNFIATHPDTRLVVVDVLQRFKGSAGKSSYSADYQELVALQQLGNKFGTAIALLHHTTKKIPTNWQASFYGTQGLPGVADTSILLDRPDFSEKGRLCVTGRKCATREWIVEFDSETLTWANLGEVKGDDLTPERKAILEALGDTNGGFLAPRELAQATGLNSKSIFNILVKLREAELVEKVKRGRYCITATGQKLLQK